MRKMTALKIFGLFLILGVLLLQSASAVSFGKPNLKNNDLRTLDNDGTIIETVQETTLDSRADDVWITYLNNETHLFILIDVQSDTENNDAGDYVELWVDIDADEEYMDNDTSGVNADTVDFYIYLDGESRGSTPLLIYGVMIGQHSLRLVKSGYADWEKEITVKELEVSWHFGNLKAGN